MKHLLLLSLLTTIVCALTAQNITNAGFENWSYESYFEEPDNFTTTNPYLVMAGMAPNVTKTTDAHSGNYALRLESVETPEDTTFGAAFIGQISEGSFAGGLPFTQRPDSVTGYARYDVQFGDTAFMAVLFKKFGAPLGICSLAFVGTQSNWAYFSSPVNWFVPIVSPDSLVAGFISSSINKPPIAGSTITFDDIAFAGASAAFPNGGFENWNEIGAEEPDDWTTTNLLTTSVSGAGVTKSTDSHSGSYAAQLESVVSFNGDSICLLTNGKVGDEGPTGGMPVNEFPKLVSGYYKYSPVGPDTALAGLWLYHYNSGTGITETLQELIIKLPPADTYTYFEIPVLYYDNPVPDTMNIAFAPSNYEGAYMGLGSTLMIDDLEVTYQPFITGTEAHDQKTVTVFPNPANDFVQFRMNDLMSLDAEIIIADMNGKIVKRYIASSIQDQTMDVSKFKPGLYFYTIRQNSRDFQGRFIVK